MSPTYVFLDEGGNFDFSPGGSKYLTMTAVIAIRPFVFEAPLLQAKYDLIEAGHELEYFHATEDQQVVRNRVFSELSSCLYSVQVNSIIVEKRKTMPHLQAVELFYPRMLGWLVAYLARGLAAMSDAQRAEIILVTDRIPVNKKRQSVEKACKLQLATISAAYQLLHHDSKSCIGLQVADYCNWAIYRKWDRADLRSYDLIKSVVATEFNIFQPGTNTYY